MSGITRCGLDLEHEEHEHPGGHCDGHVMDTPDLQPGDPVTKLFVVSGKPLPWSWPTLTLTQARELHELLEGFVADYNATYAVEQGDLIPACWPLHRGLTRELAVLFAQHVHVFQSGLGIARDAADFFERVLPRFQERLPHWLGPSASRCNANAGHKPDWNATAAQFTPATRTGMTEQEFTDAVADALLEATRSTGHLTPD